MLYIDQRGTGLSTPVSAMSLEKKGGLEEQVRWLKGLRADNIGKRYNLRGLDIR